MVITKDKYNKKSNIKEETQSFVFSCVLIFGNE